VGDSPSWRRHGGAHSRPGDEPCPSHVRRSSGPVGIPGVPFRAALRLEPRTARGGGLRQRRERAAGQPGAAGSALTAVPAVHPVASVFRTACPARPLSPAIEDSPFRYFLMKSRPWTCSAWNRLCDLQARRRSFSVEVPPSEGGRMWSTSSCQRLLQRLPSGPIQTQRPPSRSHTCRRTSAGMANGSFGGDAFGATVRFDLTAPFRFPCFSMPQRMASCEAGARDGDRRRFEGARCYMEIAAGSVRRLAQP
jgi:hypothetical protein